MKQLSIGAGFCLSFVSGWLSEASWDKLDDKVQGVYKMYTWQLFFFRRSLPPDDSNKTCANWLNKGITSPFWTAKHHGSRLPFALHSPPGLGERLQLRISHIRRSLMVEAPNRNKTCEHVNKIGGQVLTSSHYVQATWGSTWKLTKFIKILQ